MRFSIIVPVYKTEQFLAQCINSILSQKFTDFELLLVDDGSPDNSGKICDEFALQDQRVKVIHKENGGAAAARNVGIRVARGEYLCFLDADDWWVDEDVLIKINDKIEKSKASIVQFGYKFFYQEKQTYSTNRSGLIDEGYAKTGIELLTYLVANSCLNPAAWSMSISKEFLVTNDLYFKEGLKAEDIEWAIRLFSKGGSLVFLPENIYVYRKGRKDSVTAQANYKHICDHCSIIENSLIMLENMDNQSTSQLLINYVMYQLIIVAALPYRKVHNFSLEEKKLVAKRLMPICKNYLGRYTLSSKVRMATKVYKILGYTAMAKILGFYLNHRGR